MLFSSSAEKRHTCCDTQRLRKLHLRWWHAGVKPMTTILRAAGIPSEILDEIPWIVKHCRECRAWAPSGPVTIPSLSLPLKFNQQVEVDLMFYRTFIVFHMVDRCTRWHAGKIIADQQTETLLDSLSTIWIAIYGPMTQLYTDGEGGLNSNEAKDFLKRQGIELKVRAPEQHARYVERHGALPVSYTHLRAHET